MRFCAGCGEKLPDRSNLARHLASNSHCPGTGTGAWLKKGEQPEQPLRWSNWPAFYSGHDDELKDSETWKPSGRGTGSKPRNKPEREMAQPDAPRA